MSSTSVSWTFTNGTATDATKVNQNFTDLVTYINNQVIVKDGSVAATAPLSGVTPTASAHLTTKGYVDGILLNGSGAMTSYTPVWRNNATNVTVGNGASTGGYIKIGRQVFGYASLVAGTTTAFGAGTLAVTLPFTRALSGVSEPIGTASVLNSGIALVHRFAYGDSVTNDVFLATEAGVDVTNTVPFAPGVSDSYLVKFAFTATS